jgi:hypothetical protein
VEGLNEPPSTATTTAAPAEAAQWWYKKQAASSGRAAGTTCALKADWLKRPGKKAIASSLPQKQRIWLEDLGYSKEVDRYRLRCKFCKVDFDSKWDNVQKHEDSRCHADGEKDASEEANVAALAQFNFGVDSCRDQEGAAGSSFLQREPRRSLKARALLPLHPCIRAPGLGARAAFLEGEICLIMHPFSPHTTHACTACTIMIV